MSSEPSHRVTPEPWTVVDSTRKEVWPVATGQGEIVLPERFGQGRVRSIMMRAGFQCCLFQGELTRAGTLYASDPSPTDELVALGCAMVLDGDAGLQPHGFDSVAALRTGNFVLHHSAEPRLALHFQPSRLLFFNAGFSVNLLRELVSDLQVPRPLRQIMEQGRAEPFALPGLLDAHTLRLMDELRYSPYSEAATRLQYQSKALQLLAYLVERWGDERVPARHRWTQRDIDRLQEARTLLLQDLENPPALTEVAAMVGLSPTKLKMGFREVFATTMSDSLREARLQTAKDLLMQSDLPLKGVAHRVGFADAAALSHAFRAYFGFPPGQLRR